jgi:hypothetical protein
VAGAAAIRTLQDAAGGWLAGFARPGFSTSSCPRPETIGQLLGGVARGYYLLDTLGGGTRRGQRSLRGAGLPFAVQGRRATGRRIDARGTIGGLLRNILGVGRDLSFFPLGGRLARLLVASLKIRPR